jgi:hypothetical protein
MSAPRKDGTADLIRFGRLGPRRKFHLMRSVLTQDAKDMRDPMLCGASSGGLSRVILAVEHRPLAEREGWICARCLKREQRTNDQRRAAA